MTLLDQSRTGDANLGRWAVIGAGGFVGRTMLATPGNTPPGVGFGRTSHPGVQFGTPEYWHACDIGSFDTIFYCSGNTDIRITDRALMFGVHRDAPAAMIDYLRHLPSASKPRTIVYLSSAYLYGVSADGAFSEDDERTLDTKYAESKAAGEEAVLAAADDFRVLVFRPFSMIGVGQSSGFLLPKLIATFAARDKSIRLGNLDNRKDYLDIRDGCAMMIRLARNSDAAGVFNISSGLGVSVREIVASFEEITGHSVTIEVDQTLVRPNEAKQFIGKADRVRAFHAHSARPIADTLRWVLDDASNRKPGTGSHDL